VRWHGRWWEASRGICSPRALAAALGTGLGLGAGEMRQGESQV